MKQCRICKKLKNNSEFSPQPVNKDGLYGYCKPCAAARMKRYVKKMTPKQKARMKHTNRLSSKKRNKEIRKEILDSYGNRCVCCGETTKEFLSIDHINGGGCKHKKELKKEGNGYYRWIKEQGFPKDFLRLLCYNCNMSLGFNGYCPHNKNKVKVV